MKFNEFCTTVFDVLEKEEVPVSETTSFRDELDVDSLQFVNLVTRLADLYQISFNIFIENADKIGTVGGLYKVVKEGLSNECVR
jgi:acyl carrier protein